MGNNQKVILDSIARGEDFLSKMIITDDVLEGYLVDEEVKALYPAEYYRDALVKSFKNTEPRGDRLPWNKTTDFRFRKSELTILTGYNGSKKSMVLGQMVIGFLAQHKKCVICSPEMTPIQTLSRMLRQYGGVSNPDDSVIDRFFSMIRSRLWVYDQKARLKPKNILAIIRYCSEQLGIDYFVIDSLMKCGIKGTDYDAQGEFIDELTSAAQACNIHIILVAHQRKPAAGASTGGKYGVSGSADITNLAANVIECYQPTPNPNNPLTYTNALIVDKQRNYEGSNEAQPKYTFEFDNKSLQFIEHEGIAAWIPSDWGIFGGIRQQEK